MKTIKIIDLLNKIANGEEVPKKIKCKGYEYWYCNDLKDYQNAQVEYSAYLFASKYHSPNWLDYEIEILDEEDEFEDIETITSVENKAKELVRFADTINQLIYNQKKIIAKLGDKE